MFLDESGNPCVKSKSDDYDVFVLCGVVFREDIYLQFDNALKALKFKYWGNDDVIFHSYEMRNMRNEFKVFLDDSILDEFYKDLAIVFKSEYTIISCVVDKEAYRTMYPEKNLTYETSLKFICERCLAFSRNMSPFKQVHLCLERRQKGKDRALIKSFNSIMQDGTEYRFAKEFTVINNRLEFRSKKDNINGLQLADIIAYHIGRKINNPERRNIPFELFENNLMRSNRDYWHYDGYGLKVFPKKR